MERGGDGLLHDPEPGGKDREVVLGLLPSGFWIIYKIFLCDRKNANFLQFIEE